MEACFRRGGACFPSADRGEPESGTITFAARAAHHVTCLTRDGVISEIRSKLKQPVDDRRQPGDTVTQRPTVRWRLVPPPGTATMSATPRSTAADLVRPVNGTRCAHSPRMRPSIRAPGARCRRGIPPCADGSGAPITRRWAGCCRRTMSPTCRRITASRRRHHSACSAAANRPKSRARRRPGELRATPPRLAAFSPRLCPVSVDPSTGEPAALARLGRLPSHGDGHRAASTTRAWRA